MPVEHTSFEIRRRFAADRAEVFRAFSSEDFKRRWFATGGREMRNIEYELDFRPGGHEINRVVGPNGIEHLFLGHYLDIVRDARIIYAYSMHLGDIRISVSLATIAFDDDGSGTRLSFTEQAAFLDGHDGRASRIRGTEALLDGVARAVDGA
jgi:uncharacterized protein YndB with AHSA1/START domain